MDTQIWRFKRLREQAAELLWAAFEQEITDLRYGQKHVRNLETIQP